MNKDKFIKDFNDFVDNKIKNYTEEEKKDYFEASKGSVLSQYNVDYLNFRDGVDNRNVKGESIFL